MISINNEKSAKKYILNTAGYVKMQIVFLTLCTLALSYVSIRFALASKTVLDAATLSDKHHLLTPGIVQLAILVLIQLALQIVCTFLTLRSEASLKNRVQIELFENLLQKQYLPLSEYHSGELLNRLDGDVGIVTKTVITILPNVFGFISRIVLGFWLLYNLDRDFALIFIILGPLMMLIARIYSKKVKPLHKACRETSGKVHSFILDALHSIVVIKSFGVYDKMTESAKKVQDLNFKAILKRGYISIFANILFYLSLTASYYFAVSWCAYKISMGIMSIGTFAAILQLVGQVQAPFKSLASSIPQFFSMTASAERICELAEIADDNLNEGASDLTQIYNDMTSLYLNNVAFSYNNEEVFKSASVSIPKNSIVAVSGISGIGKSTLLKLLLGLLIPSGGDLGIKLTSGMTKSIDAASRRLFAYVPQGNLLISGTVRDNICFTDKNYNEEKMIKAAKDACAYSFIAELPHGFDTTLGENGLGLSEGQMQRLSVARALYSQAPILLLDEATSALDEITEKNMLQNIRALSDRTCLIVSHKDCALNMCDYIIRIENGKILMKKHEF